MEGRCCVSTQCPRLAVLIPMVFKMAVSNGMCVTYPHSRTDSRRTCAHRVQHTHAIQYVATARYLHSRLLHVTSTVSLLQRTEKINASSMVMTAMVTPELKACGLGGAFVGTTWRIILMIEAAAEWCGEDASETQSGMISGVADMDGTMNFTYKYFST